MNSTRGIKPKEADLRVKSFLRKIKPDNLIWALGKYRAPAPFSVKIATLKRLGIRNADWVETGTYLGETTKRLAKFYPKNVVYSIEPSIQLYSFSAKKLKNLDNVRIFNGTSETEFEKILEKIHGGVNCWLDGHFSGDITFQGKIDSPILHELTSLRGALARFSEVRIFIDDFRLFGIDVGYPGKKVLIDWCDQNGCTWSVENDIFIITK